MSKTIDERVVEMRFDNKQFESNVQTSLSTIEKLKKSLDIDSLIDDVFGTGVNPDPDEPTYSPDDIATEKELNDAITDVFG